MIILDFDVFLNKKGTKWDCTKWCFCIFFSIISLKKVWKFNYLIFNKFVLTKDFAGMSF